MAKEEDKGDVKSLCAKCQKMHQSRWRKLKFIRIDYEQLVMNIFGCVFKSMEDLTYLISKFSLVS